LDYRLNIFKIYTLKSLAKQKFRDFSVWIHCEPGMEEAMMPLGDEIPNATVTFGDHYPPSKVPECEWVYVTRIDSDDLYSSDAVDLVNSYTPSELRVEASVFQKGYVHDLNTKEWAIYWNPSSPFHCVMFPRKIFLDRTEYYRHFVGDHSKVRTSYPTQTLPDFKFCVLIHGRNWTSSFGTLAKQRLSSGCLADFL
jgi:hypothetical protein